MINRLVFLNAFQILKALQQQLHGNCKPFIAQKDQLDHICQKNHRKYFI